MRTTPDADKLRAGGVPVKAVDPRIDDIVVSEPFTGYAMFPGTHDKHSVAFRYLDPDKINELFLAIIDVDAENRLPLIERTDVL